MTVIYAKSANFQPTVTIINDIMVSQI